MTYTPYLLRATAYSVAASFCLVTICANAMFAVSLGASILEKSVCVLMSVSADVFKCIAVLLCLRLWARRRLALAAASIGLGLMCLAWSTLSATGFALSVRHTTEAIHAAIADRHNGWITIVRRAGEQLEPIHRHRPEQIIQAELAAQMVPAATWRRTRECSELTLPESRDACARVLTLRQELAAAQSARALEEQIAEARRQLATVPVVGPSADPQVAGLAALVGTEEPTLRRGLALLLAVLVELGSACGFALASAATANPSSRPQAPSQRRTTAPSNAPRASEPSSVVGFPQRSQGKLRARRPAIPPDPSLVRWAEQCVRRDHHGCIGARATYQLYCRWAQDVGVTAVSETAFGRYLTSSIPTMGGSKAERGKGAFYLGIRIVPAPDEQAVRRAA